jgi:hypothetical protein
MGITPIFFPTVFAMECQQYSDSSFELILNCIDTIDVKKDTMELMYGDVGQFSSSLEGAKVYDIRFEDSVTFATLEIPLPLVNDLKSDVKFTQSSNYFLEFLNGDLSGSSLLISLSETTGFDGTKNGGSEVSFTFQINKVPCFAFGLKCGTAEDFEYALDRGLYLIESKAKELQGNLDEKNEIQINSLSTDTKFTYSSNQKENNKELTSTTINFKNTPRINFDDDTQKMTAKTLLNTGDDVGFKERFSQLVLHKGMANVDSGFTLSPKLQMYLVYDQSEIVCKDGLEIIFKTSTGDPACVNPSSVKKLVQRGWTS